MNIDNQYIAIKKATIIIVIIVWLVIIVNGNHIGIIGIRIIVEDDDSEWDPINSGIVITRIHIQEENHPIGGWEDLFLHRGSFHGSSFCIQIRQDMIVSWHGGSSQIIHWRIFHEINHPASLGYPPFLETPHMIIFPIGAIVWWGDDTISPRRGIS